MENLTSIDGIWFSDSAGYLVFNTREEFVISAHRIDGEGSKFIAYSAWFRAVEKFVMEIRLCNLQRPAEWKVIHYRILDEELQWSNEARDFFFKRLDYSEVCEDAITSIQRADTMFMKKFSKVFRQNRIDAEQAAAPQIRPRW